MYIFVLLVDVKVDYMIFEANDGNLESCSEIEEDFSDDEGFVFVWETYQTKLTRYFKSSKRTKTKGF